MSKVYQNYFDIAHMIDTALAEHICFVIAVSEDKERGAGKTYSSAKYFYSKYKNSGSRFVVFVRDVKELGHMAEGIFGNFLHDTYPDMTIYEKLQDKIYSNIYTRMKNPETGEEDVELIGFVIPLKNAKNIKNYRGIFQSANVKFFYMDEFMPIDGRYLKDETDLMKTIYDTVNGLIEDLPIIMTANCISLGNPYFTMLGLNGKIQSNTRKIKTDTVVYENVTVEGLAEKHLNSAANRAFRKVGSAYETNVWIGDNNSLVCKPDNWGHGRYVATIIYQGTQMGVLYYATMGLTYVSRKIEKNCNYVYNLTPEGDLSIPLIRTAGLLQTLRKDFFAGAVRCHDGGIQRILMTIFGC